MNREERVEGREQIVRVVLLREKKDRDGEGKEGGDKVSEMESEEDRASTEKRAGVEECE